MEMEEVYMESPKTSLKIKIKTIRGAEKGVVSSNTGKNRCTPKAITLYSQRTPITGDRMGRNNRNIDSEQSSSSSLTLDLYVFVKKNFNKAAV